MNRNKTRRKTDKQQYTNYISIKLFPETKEKVMIVPINILLSSLQILMYEAPRAVTCKNINYHYIFTASIKT